MFSADFLVDSALSAACGGDVVFASWRFGEGAVFSEAADDHPSLDGTSDSFPLLSAGFNVMPFA